MLKINKKLEKFKYPSVSNYNILEKKNLSLNIIFFTSSKTNLLIFSKYNPNYYHHFTLKYEKSIINTSFYQGQFNNCNK
jgi:hypothetical protein